MARRLRVHFVKDLGFIDAVGLGIGFIVGSGIYIMPMLMAKQTGALSLLAWVIGGLFSIITGLCFAECAVRIPKVGGLYAFAHRALGNFWGFVTGYTFWLGYTITIAVEMLAIALYLDFFWPAPLIYRVAAACAVGIAFTWINYRGVKLGGEVEDALTVGKIIPLLLLVGIGALLFKPERFASATAAQMMPLLGSVILALWAYQGAEVITVPEEEIRHAKKTVPKAIIVSVFTVMLLYLLVAGAVLTLDWQAFANSQAPLADLASSVVGKWGGAVLAVGGLLSILGALNAVILASARISYAMSEDRLFPKYFNHLHEKHGTPDRALIAHILIAVALCLALQDFTALASLVVLFTLAPYLFSCIATFVLQRREYHVHSILGNSQVIPAIAILASLGLLAYSWTTQPILSTAFLAAGIAWFALAKPLPERANKAKPTNLKRKPHK